MENVEGLLLGGAWSYVQKIYKDFSDIGYNVNHWLLKGEYMGVPQKRHRVFFVAIRRDLNVDPKELNMDFNFEQVTYSMIKEGKTFPIKRESKYYEIISKANENDKCIADTRERCGEKASAFQTYYIRKNDIMPTLRTSADMIDLDERAYVSLETIINMQTFPADYIFENMNRSHVVYICGMSVPPIMMKRVVLKLIEQDVFAYKNK